MPLGNLELPITDLLRRPIGDPVLVEMRRDAGPAGAGGGDFDFTAEPGGATALSLNGIPTRGGPGSLYRIRISVRGYLPCSFAQFITEGDQLSIQRVYLVRDPKRVASIDAPPFGKLPEALRNWLGDARMIALATEDEDLAGKSGEDLYDALGNERKAALLNIFAKARHKGTVGLIWNFFERLLVIRRDRCFVEMKAGIEAVVSEDSRFVSAPSTLHKPMPGYRLSNSVKSDDQHANIQLTFQRNAAGGIAADVDIDEHSGFAHWGEVLRNHFTKHRTNPYAIHELLLAADLEEHTLNPGYELIMKA
ncbi:MAG: hypothetical protein IT170_00650 [Bryobacterales bacterium]|nr:hypothetical protein [Bryobacterales bacterium]